MPNFEAIAFTALGSTMLWARLRREQLTVWSLGKLWALCGFESKHLERMEFIGFVVCGSVVGVAATHPQTVMQAITAGLGWTGLLATHGSQVERNAAKSRGSNRRRRMAK